MRNSANRPKQPFLDDQGRPRLRVALSPHGPTEYRAGQAIVDIAGLGGDQAAPDRVLDELRKIAEIDLDATDVDRRQAARSGYLRVLFDPGIEVAEVLRRVNADRQADVVFPNTVFRVGSLTADPMRFGSSFGADPMRFGSAYGADPMRFGNSSTARPSVRPTPLATSRDKKVRAGPSSPSSTREYPSMGHPNCSRSTSSVSGRHFASRRI